MTEDCMVDARNVGHIIDATFVVKPLERIGDHSGNIAEYVIFLTAIPARPEIARQTDRIRRPDGRSRVETAPWSSSSRRERELLSFDGQGRQSAPESGP